MNKPQTLTNVILIDPENNREFKGGLVISDGIIEEVFEGTREGIDLKGHYLAPGIIDIGVKVGEPGERHKESFRSASNAALAGGVTTMVTRPDTNPAIDTPEILSFAKARANQTAFVNVHIQAAITKNRAGDEMTEIGFLKDAGAVAFSDGDAIIQNTKTAQRAYTYIAMKNGLVIGHIQEAYLSEGAVATSGTLTTKLGLPSTPALAEKIGLQREMALVELTGVRYHVDQITTSCSLPVLERAKNAGFNVTAGTSVHHLTLNALDVGDFRTFYKIKPPLRSEEDRQDIIKAVKNGLVDIISSMHTPQDEESKRLPFDEAAAGAVALETLLPASLSLVHNGDLTLCELFRAISLNPARLLGLNAGSLAVGSNADLVLFDLNKPWILDRHQLKSKAKNTPFDGAKMQGQVLATWVNGEKKYAQ